MYSVAQGPANRSYGLHVAKLAGIPEPVLARARLKLTELESAHDRSRPDSAGEIGSATPQMSLFAKNDDTELVAAELATIDPDSLSPREALDALYRLRQLAGIDS